MNETENYLAHYGVLGMKWGVRHDPGKAYYKASKKAVKLQKKAETLHEKAARAQHKARTSRYGITDTGRTIWENRQIKAGKANRRADKATRKAERWMRQMRKVFLDISLDELDRRLYKMAEKRGEPMLYAVGNSYVAVSTKKPR